MAAPPVLRIGGEESPGSMEARCRITSGGGDPRESATESRPLRQQIGLTARFAEHPIGCFRFAGGVRVKGCGKSAPRLWQQRRHGKPHREQDRIGAARARDRSRLLSDELPGLVARGASQDAPQMNGHHLAKAGNRTRLTGLVTCYGRREGKPLAPASNFLPSIRQDE